MGILIGADFIPTKNNQQSFVNGNIHALLGQELVLLLKNADYRIFNLEEPLTDCKIPIKKRGPNLSGSKESVNAYKEANVDLFTLANNHIMDYGADGLNDTITVLQEAGINYVGAGENTQKAAEPFYFQFNGKVVGVFACVQHEYSVATECTAGANPFDAFESLDQIEKMKETCDYAIVLYHGGRECYRYPTPYLQKLCRKMIEKGADLVVCQHSHCIGCKEIYKGGTIIYGQGNFLFAAQNNEYWNTSILIRINKDFSIDYLPVVSNGNGVQIAKDDVAGEIVDQFAHRSELIKKGGFIYESFDELCKKEYENTLYCVAGRESYFVKIMNKLFFGRLRKRMLQKKYNEKALFLLENTLVCEPHYEVLLHLLRNKKS